MAAQSMDDSTIRDLESQCKQANADFHRTADSAIKHADILERQVSSGKLDSSKYRVTPKKPSLRGDAKV
jgi:hypothetical protein